MLERLQSALKTVKDSKPSSLMSHRFVTVRRGSPAARSGQIQPGDQLEAVEGRAVGGLQHRDLAQILRRAGNTLRLSITPRHTRLTFADSSSLTEGADLDIDGRLMKGSRGRSKDESRFYSVDLERGPTGFGFSLRGGSEYNMGLYVLGLMDGGPAQRSNKIQVSDQLVEINGDTTVGMTHSQAVEQIRRGGHRIHLVLKKGNGYVPDYGPEEGALSPSSTSYTEEQDVDMVTMTTTSLSLQRGGGRTEGGGGEKRTRRREGETKRRTGGGGGGGSVPPDLDLDLVEEQARKEEIQRKEEEERRQQEEEEEEERRRKKKEEVERKRKSQTMKQKDTRDHQKEQERRSRSLPRNGARSWDTLVPQEEVEESGGERQRRRRSETKSRRREREEEEKGGGRSGKEEDNTTIHHAKHSGSSFGAQRTAFSFLMPMDDDEYLSDNESATSFSEVSLSAASITTTGWSEHSDWTRAQLSQQQEDAPGPWLKPSPQRLTKVLIGSRLNGRGLEGGLSL